MVFKRQFEICDLRSRRFEDFFSYEKAKFIQYHLHKFYKQLGNRETPLMYMFKQLIVQMV